MGLRIWVCLLFFFVLWLVAGCKETTSFADPSIAVYEVNIPDFARKPWEMEHFAIIPETGSGINPKVLQRAHALNEKHAMLYVKPESSIGYKILQKVPDPNEGHAMLYVTPEKDQSELKLDQKKETHSEKQSSFVLP